MTSASAEFPPLSLRQLEDVRAALTWAREEDLRIYSRRQSLGMAGR